MRGIRKTALAKAVSSAAAVLLGAVILAACGQKGALYLPAEPAAQPVAEPNMQPEVEPQVDPEVEPQIQPMASPVPASESAAAK